MKISYIILPQNVREYDIAQILEPNLCQATYHIDESILRKVYLQGLVIEWRVIGTTLKLQEPRNYVMETLQNNRRYQL